MPTFSIVILKSINEIAEELSGRILNFCLELQSVLGREVIGGYSIS